MQVTGKSLWVILHNFKFIYDLILSFLKTKRICVIPTVCQLNFKILQKNTEYDFNSYSVFFLRSVLF